MSENELARLTGDSTGESIDTSMAEAAIASAESLIDAYLYGRYQVPIEEPEEIIKQISVKIAIFNLFSNKFRGSFVPNEVLASKLEAMSLLEGVFSGKIRLRAAARNVGIITNNRFKKRYFTDENLEQFRDYRE